MPLPQRRKDLNLRYWRGVPTGAPRLGEPIEVVSATGPSRRGLVGTCHPGTAKLLRLCPRCELQMQPSRAVHDSIIA